MKSILAIVWNKLMRVPVLSFLLRNFLLTVGTFLLNWLPVWSHALKYVYEGEDQWGNPVWRGITLFDQFGSAIYIPGIIMLACWCEALTSHLFFRETIDADGSSGKYVRDWHSLEPSQRVLYTVIRRSAFLTGAAIIAAGIAK